ncbi:MAG: GTPase HflX [Lachnospiraceae bacterium]|nr:GTPase HflX [Lachnospiraceae bacterium]
MAELFEIKEEAERVVLVGVQTSQNDDTEESLRELEELARTAHAQTLGTIIQNRESVHPGTYIGKGKIEEVAQMVEQLSATGIICDDELSPAQMKNLEAALGCKVMDRTMLILDIFAQHAVTREGKIQVELAQLKYRQTRLIGMHDALSRLGAGIGTRGPGEKKLEMDRRLIKDRIGQLNKELADVKKNREVARSLRSKSPVPVAAIVGFTNAGKSTLLNYLTDAGVLSEDMLFATLDPTTRNVKLESGEELLLTDTVGFIRKLPHHLIDAFRSTLEEAKYSDIILHVVDASSEEAEAQMYVVYETLRQLGIKEKTIITVFNKQDLVSSERVIKDLKSDKSVKISAKTGEGIPELLSVIGEVLRGNKQLVEKLFSYEDAGKLALIRKYGQLFKEEYREDGIFVQAYVPGEIFHTL